MGIKSWLEKRAARKHELLKVELDHAIFHKGFLLMYCKKETKLIEQAEKKIKKLRERLTKGVRI